MNPNINDSERIARRYLPLPLPPLEPRSTKHKPFAYSDICRSSFGGLILLSALINAIAAAGDYTSHHQMSPNVHPFCGNFTVGNEQRREFFSPNWPNNYPRGVNCTRVLTAPLGQVIRLDFRDTFHLEPSKNCQNDYLLVRDGKEAYSRKILQACDHHFPKMIISTGRHLWLRFRSDESIEYSGFKAVYDFIETESSVLPPHCTFSLAGSQSIISSDNVSREAVVYAEQNHTPLDCKWRIAVSSGSEIKIAFKKFSLAKPNECEVNFVEILYGPELSLTSRQVYCSSKADSVKLGVNQEVTFRYYAASHVASSGDTQLLAVVTELRPREDNEPCAALTEFDCDDLYCINSSLLCNGYYNCDKQLDEKADRCAGNAADSSLAFITTDTNIVILTIGCALLVGMCVSVVWNCMRKLRQDFAEKEEMMRRSQVVVDGGQAGGAGGGVGGAGGGVGGGYRSTITTTLTKNNTTSSDGDPGNTGCYVPHASDTIKTTQLQLYAPRHQLNSCDYSCDQQQLQLAAAAAAASVDRGCQTPRLLLRRDQVDIHSMCSSSLSSPQSLPPATPPYSSTPPPPPPPPPPRSHQHLKIGDTAAMLPAKTQKRAAAATTGEFPMHVSSYSWRPKLPPRHQPTVFSAAAAADAAAAVTQSLSSPNVQHLCSDGTVDSHTNCRQQPMTNDLTRPHTFDRSWKTGGCIGGGGGHYRDPQAPLDPQNPLDPITFRAETVIAMTGRPHSMYTAKSAPDVVVKI